MKTIIENNEMTLIPENENEKAKIEQYTELAKVFGDAFIINSIKRTYNHIEEIEKVKDVKLIIMKQNEI